MVKQKQVIRESVSKAYARALSAECGSGCCGNAPQGELAKRAGYQDQELAGVPVEAVRHSFGCGNPLAFSEVGKGQVVLDLGSGAGIDVVLAAKKVGPTGRVIGVDMTDAMIAKAKETVAQAGLSNVEIRQGIIEALPVESSSVDWVISNCVINLSPEKPRVFAEIARVLKPGGRMIVSDVIADDLPAAVRQDLGMYSSCVAGALSAFEYRDGLEHAGLADVEVRKSAGFSAGQVEALIESDERTTDACGCRSSTVRADLAEACAGKVWSALISARKPAA